MKKLVARIAEKRRLATIIRHRYERGRDYLVAYLVAASDARRLERELSSG